MTSGRPLTIPARDGYPLGATLYQATHPRGVAVVHGATAVPHRFYGAFAAALAEAGWSTITYDYRGIAASRRGPLKGFPATASDWGLLDMPGANDWALANLGDDLALVGHSIGGQLAGLYDAPERVRRIVTVSAQSGHWRHQPGAQKLLVALHVFVTMPLLAHVLGYVPWSRFAAGEDLPAGVALQWSRWCRHRDYLFSDRSLPLERYRAFTAPVLAYSFEDDPWGSRRSVDVFMRHYPDVTRVHVDPRDHGIDRIGHVGFFRTDARPLWNQSIAWLTGEQPADLTR